MKKFIGMGDYYNRSPEGLVKVVCRAIDDQSGEDIICYSRIKKGGICSEIYCMPETEFYNIFIREEW